MPPRIAVSVLYAPRSPSLYEPDYARSNRRKQVVVPGLERIVLPTTVPPLCLARLQTAAGDVGVTLGTVSVLRDTVPVTPHRDDVADRSVLETLDRLEIAVLVMPLQANTHSQILLLGQLGRGQNLPDTRCVGGDRLFTKHMLAGLDGGREMSRTETRRSGHDHQIHVAGDQLLVGFKPGELPLGRHSHPLLSCPHRTNNPLQAAFQLVGKCVGHGHQLHRALGRQRLGRRSRPALGQHAGQTSDHHSTLKPQPSSRRANPLGKTRPSS